MAIGQRPAEPIFRRTLGGSQRRPASDPARRLAQRGPATAAMPWRGGGSFVGLQRCAQGTRRRLSRPLAAKGGARAARVGAGGRRSAFFDAALPPFPRRPRLPALLSYTLRRVLPAVVGLTRFWCRGEFPQNSGKRQTRRGGPRNYYSGLLRRAPADRVAGDSQGGGPATPPATLPATTRATTRAT